MSKSYNRCYDWFHHDHHGSSSEKMRIALQTYRHLGSNWVESRTFLLFNDQGNNSTASNSFSKGVLSSKWIEPSHFMATAIYTLIYLHWIWNNIPIYPDIPWKCGPWDATTHLARLVAKPWNVLPHTAGTSHCDSHLTMTWPSLLYGASTYLSDLI